MLKGKKAAFHNLGCKVNAYETDVMEQELKNAGCEIVPFAPGADIYVINTCTVTNIADRKSRQMLHKAKKMNPEGIVVAVGCYAQEASDTLKDDSAIDMIIGNNRKGNLAKHLAEYYGKSREQMVKDVVALDKAEGYEALSLSHTASHTRAYVKIQDGCNMFCSYCIIPYARGRVRSRHMDDILEEISRLEENGYKEVVLTGIHLSSYGLDQKDASLIELIESIHRRDGIERIRLGSLEPRIITEEFTGRLAALPKVCDHFHLSLQSGCDETLMRMNRKYSAKEYEKACTLLRKAYSNPALTTDVIVGFPGETKEEYEKSRTFVDKIGFYETHIFKYSRRKGTKADKMENQVPEQIKNERSADMIALGNRHSKAYELERIGKSEQVLLEEMIHIDGKAAMVGHTREYVKCAFFTNEDLSNQFVTLEIEKRLDSGILIGKVSQKGGY